jgi:hypothetical protein
MRQDEVLNEILKLTEGDLIVKVFINLLEDIFNLLLGLIESQSLQQRLDLRRFNRTALILVMSVENLFEFFDQVLREVVLLDLHVFVETKRYLEVDDADLFPFIRFEEFEDFFHVLFT